jgi:hypothetical protein
MIKFFRKIRYNLMETGKTGKYFKYAIGEIVLVVIGILIALSINNWNQNRLESQTITVYLKNLKKDLETDIEYFEFSIGNHVGRFYSLQNLLELSGQSKLNLSENEEVLPVARSSFAISSENLKEDLARTFRVASRPYRAYVNTTTIEELKGTGIFSKISNQELKSSINNYYALIELTMGENQQEQLQKGIDQWRNSLIKEGVFPMDISNIENPLILLSNNPERVAIVKSLIRKARWISYATNNSQERAENLIKLIAVELEKN